MTLLHVLASVSSINYSSSNFMIIIIFCYLTCADFNECEIPGKCSQICHNTKGSYYCKCVDGYNLAINKHSCKALSKCIFKGPLSRKN